jgi:hypothetical protein
MSADLTKRVETRTDRLAKLEPGDPYTLIDTTNPYAFEFQPGEMLALHDSVHGPAHLFKVRSVEHTPSKNAATLELSFINRKT